MAITLATFLAQVEILIGPDESNLELDDSELNTLIKAAVEQYGRDAPSDVTEDITGDGGKYYGIAAELASWVEGFSRIVEVEYPANAIADDEQPIYLDGEDWRDDYFDGSTRYLFFPNHTPTASETIRVKYTAPYVWTDPGGGEQTTVPAQDFYAICNLAACHACRAIATKYSRSTDSTIAADSVRHVSKADQFARRASEYCGVYADEMGLAGGDDVPFVPASGDFLDMDTAPSWPTGRRFLFHGQDTR